MIQVPSTWNPSGDESVSAAKLNEPVEAIRALIQQAASRDDYAPAVGRGRLCVIAATGPKGSEADFTNHRYWVTYSDADNGAEPDSPVAVEARPKAGGEDETVTFVATNLTELLGQSHSLPAGTPVWVYPIYGTSTKASESQSLRWVFCSDRHVCLVKVTGSAAGGGKYTGTVWSSPTVDVPAAGDLSEAELGIAGATVRILNSAEVGKATHDLAATGFLPLIFPAQFLKVAADGVPVYLINGSQIEDCTEGA